MYGTYLIYNTLIRAGGLFLMPYWIYKLATEKKQRTGFFEKLRLFSSSNNHIAARRKNTIWIHTVSVGELNAALPLIKKLKIIYPESNFTISTVTPTGNKLAREKLSETDQVIYFPYDFKGSVRKAIASVRPSLCVIFETELWPNFLRELKLRNIPSVIVNGRISSRSFKRYSAVSYFMRDILKNVTLFCMQSERDKERIITLGADREKVRICGNIKYEQNIKQIDAGKVEEIRASLGIIKKTPVMVAGSTHPGEEDIILDTYKRLLNRHPNLALLIAPRHIERVQDVTEIIKKAGFTPAKTTMIEDKKFEYSPGRDVLLLNTIGELTKIYAAADIVFIGGSLIPHGGQNILEPAYHKKPVLFGKHMDNFKDIAREMIDSEGGIMITGTEELFSTIDRLISDSVEMKRIGENGYGVITRNRGALQKNVEIIQKVLLSQ